MTDTLTKCSNYLEQDDITICSDSEIVASIANSADFDLTDLLEQ